MDCVDCGANNDKSARYCTACGASLLHPCLVCGAVNPKAAAFCSNCGKPLGARPTLRKAKAASHGSGISRQPGHGAAAPSVEIADRKIATALFADVAGSTLLIRHADPEDAAAKLSPILMTMVAAAEEYGGRVFTQGDGILAVFGVPKAKEDHALRACLAAANILSRVRSLSNASVNIRIGLHSGEIAVGTITHETGSELSVSGDMIHVAKKLEESAEPGSMLLSAETYKLVADHVITEPATPLILKGQMEPIEVFKLVGSISSVSRWHARARLQLSRFVGRKAELAALFAAWQRVLTDCGQLITVDGDPGVGKSRLVHQFVEAESVASYPLLEAAATSVDRNSALRPIISMLRARLGIDSNNDRDAAVSIIEPLMDARRQNRQEMVDAILSLLDFEPRDSAWTDLDPAQKREHTLKAVCMLVAGFAGEQPTVLIFEDLHWADSGSLEVINRLSSLVASHRILLILTFRSPFSYDWAQRSAHHHIRVHPLERDAAEEMLAHLLGSSPQLDNLKQHIIDNSECTPLFLEELVRALETSGTLCGKPGRRRLGRPFGELAIPTTVQPVIAERIDRLDPDQKELLQIAAVMGRECPTDLLFDASPYSERDGRRIALSLVREGLMYEQFTASQTAYVFKHALIQQVAYQSLPRDRRGRLHADVFQSVFRLRRDKTQENIQLLAYHAGRGQLWPEAARYGCVAGSLAIQKSAFSDAIEFFQEALKCTLHLPRDADSLRLSMDARLGLRMALFATEDFWRTYDLIYETEALAVELDDKRTLLRTSVDKTIMATLKGSVDKAVAFGREALERASEAEDRKATANARFALAQAEWFRGGFTAAKQTILANLDGLRDLRTSVGTGTTGSISVLSYGTLANALSCLGEFDRAHSVAETARALAEEMARPYDISFSKCSMGILCLKKGELQDAIRWLEESRAACVAGHIDILKPFVAGPLARAYSNAGRYTEARMLLNDAYAIVERMDMAAFRAWCLLPAANIDLRQGALDDCRVLVDRLRELCQRNGYRALEAEAMWLDAWLLESIDAQESRRRLNYAIAAAERLQMLPEVAWWRRALTLRPKGLGEEMVEGRDAG